MISFRNMSKSLVVAGCLFAVPCLASTFTYSTPMLGSQENPANASQAFGFATLYLTGDLLTVHETFSGLSATASGAHIHCCSVPSVNAPVVVPFATFPAATSGTFDNTFDLSTFVFGGGLTETTFLAGLNSGLAYVNIHDRNFPGGEIRGQLASITPEPGSLGMLGTGLLAGLAGLQRRVRVYRATL